MVEDLSKERTGEENLAGRLIQAQEEERARIARKLRNDVNEKLVLLSINLDQVQQILPQAAAGARQKIGETRDQLLNLGNDVHALWNDLHSAKLEYLGLPAAASSFCRDASRQREVKVDFSSVGVSDELPAGTALCLYRVLQEAVQNAIKHSGSQSIEVLLCSDSQEISLTVRDWGIGFDLEGSRGTRGLGLASLKERLSLVNGGLSIESWPQRGTTIGARVPLTKRAETATAS
jgi:signal transduction histidine kinase